MAVEITQRVALVGHEEPVNNIGWAGSLGVEIVATYVSRNRPSF